MNRLLHILRAPIRWHYASLARLAWHNGDREEARRLTVKSWER